VVWQFEPKGHIGAVRSQTGQQFDAPGPPVGQVYPGRQSRESMQVPVVAAPNAMSQIVVSPVAVDLTR
jgi:hypothetical protein